MPRLSRVEQRTRTRELLLEAAERVFRRDGFHEASVEKVAEEAGFSKGAVYSNFEGKDDLLLAVLERRHDSRALALELAIDGTQSVLDQADQAGRAWIDLVVGEPEWSLLLIEYATHVARHPDLRERFAQRYRRLRVETARMIDEHLSALGLRSPIPVDQLAAVLVSLGDGVMLGKLTDPERVPDDTFAIALKLMFAGLLSATGA